MKYTQIMARIDKINESIKKIECQGILCSQAEQIKLDSELQEIEDFLENVKPVLDLVEYCEELVSNN